MFFALKLDVVLWCSNAFFKCVCKCRLRPETNVLLLFSDFCTAKRTLDVLQLANLLGCHHKAGVIWYRKINLVYLQWVQVKTKSTNGDVFVGPGLVDVLPLDTCFQSNSIKWWSPQHSMSEWVYRTVLEFILMVFTPFSSWHILWRKLYKYVISDNVIEIK